MQYISLLIIIVSGIMYHITQKSIPGKANPVVSIIITYLVALTISLLMLFFDKDKTPFFEAVKELNWASYALGISIVGIEIGYLLAYRVGWDIGRLNLIYTLLISMILIPLGIALFQEHYTLRTLIGIGVSIIGLIIIKL